MKVKQDRRTPKHARIFAALRRDLDNGRLIAGAKLPSEAQLAQRFGVSRITAIRAVRDLQALGLVERRPGAGTFVRRTSSGSGYSFGLLVPDLIDTEIFEPLCQGIVSSPQARDHQLLWGHSTAERVSDEAVLDACRHYIEQKVDGVFFAPLISSDDAASVNRKVLGALDSAGIPVVLLDRTALPYPQAPDHDLVGIDNRRAGYRVTEHLIEIGSRRIGFIAGRRHVSTTDARVAGYREALLSFDLPFEPCMLLRSDSFGTTELREYLQLARLDAIVCVNDRTAGAVLHALKKLNIEVPSMIRVVGIDDVPYAALLPVPLTTLRQPAKAIGDVAMTVMLDRIARPSLPARETRLACALIVRESCGAGARLAGKSTSE